MVGMLEISQFCGKINLKLPAFLDKTENVHASIFFVFGTCET